MHTSSKPQICHALCQSLNNFVIEVSTFCTVCYIWYQMFYISLWRWSGIVLCIPTISPGLYKGEVVCFTYSYNLTRAVWRWSGMFYISIQCHQAVWRWSGMFNVSVQFHQGCMKVKWYCFTYPHNLSRAVWRSSGIFYISPQSHQGCMKVKWYVLHIPTISPGLYEGEVVCFTYPYNLTRAVWRSSGMFYISLQSHQGCMKVKWYVLHIPTILPGLYEGEVVLFLPLLPCTEADVFKHHVSHAAFLLLHTKHSAER